ncbi:hypothetical protein MCOR25_004761 [Pyricularia grisea]|nr:hypothetical protein MCOR25_004761 [Pyricularia grisea]
MGWYFTADTVDPTAALPGVFARINGDSIKFKKLARYFKTLDKDQRKVFKESSKLPFGFMVVQGVPGTGKTFLATVLLLDALMDGVSHSGIVKYKLPEETEQPKRGTSFNKPNPTGHDESSDNKSMSDNLVPSDNQHSGYWSNEADAKVVV